MARSTTSRTGWWKADLASKLWQDTARTSAITADGQTVKAMDDQQASNHFTEATNGPLWKTPSGLLLPALRFDGVNDEMATTAAPSTFYGTSAKTILIAFRLLGDGTNLGTIYNNTMIVGDNKDGGFDQNWFGLYVKTVAGVHTLHVYNWDGNEDTVSATISKNTNYIIAVRHDGTNIYIGIDGGSETSAASGATAGGGPVVRIAGNRRSAGDQYLNCEIGEVAMYNAAITGTALSDTIQAMMDDWVTAPAGGILRQMMMRH